MPLTPVIPSPPLLWPSSRRPPQVRQQGRPAAGIPIAPGLSFGPGRSQPRCSISTRVASSPIERNRISTSVASCGSRRRCHEYTSRPGGSQTTTLPQSNSSPSASARRCGPRRGPPSRSSGRLDQCACGRPATIDRGRGCRCRTRVPGARRPRTRGEAGRSSTAPSRWRGVLGDDPVARRSLAPDRGEYSRTASAPMSSSAYGRLVPGRARGPVRPPRSRR